MFLRTSFLKRLWESGQVTFQSLQQDGTEERMHISDGRCLSVKNAETCKSKSTIL